MTKTPTRVGRQSDSRTMYQTYPGLSETEQRILDHYMWPSDKEFQEEIRQGFQGIARKYVKELEKGVSKNLENYPQILRAMRMHGTMNAKGISGYARLPVRMTRGCLQELALIGMVTEDDGFYRINYDNLEKVLSRPRSIQKSK